jgi:Fic/DOC family
VVDWDEDSPRLRSNLAQVLRSVRDAARRRSVPKINDARNWQRDTIAGLGLPDSKYVGRFRGEPGLKTTRVWIGSRQGAAPSAVTSELAKFERILQRAVTKLDQLYPVDAEIDADGLAAIIDLAAWAHAEWVRIHPFANGNGRTARLWANYVFVRYGLPPVVRLRPRPDGGYGEAAAAAMSGDWQSTALVFRKLLLDAVTERT